MALKKSLASRKEISDNKQKPSKIIAITSSMGGVEAFRTTGCVDLILPINEIADGIVNLVFS